MIDTHCHLTFDDYAGRVPAVLDEARAAGVRACVTVATTPEDCPRVAELAEAHEGVWHTAGVHPLYSDRVGTGGAADADWAAVADAARRPKCVAWGELGLDNHYSRPERRVQDSVLREQLELIESLRAGDDPVDLPVVLHCREAFADLIPVLERTTIDPARFVFHCFTGDESDMRRVVAFGAWVSFTGVLTYRNAADVRAAAALAPLDRVMVETDAPFLTPAPHRGVRPNEPKYVVHTAAALAEIRGVPAPELERTLDANAERFFGITIPA